MKKIMTPSDKSGGRFAALLCPLREGQAKAGDLLANHHRKNGIMKTTNNRQYIICGLCLLLVATCFWGCKPERIETGKPVDVDGNIYDTVRIGSQTWMCQDLKVKHFPNGIALQEFQIGLKEPAFLEYNGKMLYNALAAQYGGVSANGHIQGICPDGWHLPSRDEWQQLTDYITEHPALWESSGTVSRALASQQWSSSSEAAQFNQTGFSALPTGYLISYARHTELPNYEEQIEQRWTQRGNAYYWSTDHNDYYPISVTPNESPWTMPQVGWFGDDSLEVQSYVLLLNISQEKPEISSLPDIHYCAVRCVKD